MNLSIALSESNIIDRLLACSALRHYLSEARPEVLTRDNIPALSRLIRGAIASLALELGWSLRRDDESADVTVIEASVGVAGCAVAVRELIESAVADTVAATAYAGCDAAVEAHFALSYRRSLESLRSLIGAGRARIEPCRW